MSLKATDGFLLRNGNNMHEKISPESKEYGEFKESLKIDTETFRGDESWGSDVLMMLRMNEVKAERLREQVKGDDPESPEAKHIEELERRNQEELRRSFENYIALDKDPKTKGSTIFLMAEAMQDPSIREELSALIPKGRLPLSNRIVEAIVQKTERGEEFSMELWERMLEQNQKTFLEKLRVFQEKVLPELKQKFLEAVHSATEKGTVPIPEEKIRQMLDTTAFILRDPTAARLENNMGRYDPENNTILVASYLVDSYLHAPEWEKSVKQDKDMAEFYGDGGGKDRAEKYRKMAEHGRANLLHTFYHEALHMLSGKTVVTEYEEGAEHLADFEHKKIGLRHVGKKVARFRWLNEAMTEHVTTELTGDHDKKYAGYKKELELFELLRTKGKKEIPLELFKNAYFENFDPDQNEQERLRHWKLLRLELAEAYEHDFIVKLDKTIQEKGIDHAIKSLKEGLAV